MTSWDESEPRSEWLGYVTIALLLPLAFIGAFELLNFLLLQLARVFA